MIFQCKYSYRRAFGKEFDRLVRREGMHALIVNFIGIRISQRHFRAGHTSVDLDIDQVQASAWQGPTVGTCIAECNFYASCMELRGYSESRSRFPASTVAFTIECLKAVWWPRATQMVSHHKCLLDCFQFSFEALSCIVSSCSLVPISRDRYDRHYKVVNVVVR